MRNTYDVRTLSIIEKCVIITENRNKYHGTISLLKIELSLYNANVVTERM